MGMFSQLCLQALLDDWKTLRGFSTPVFSARFSTEYNPCDDCMEHTSAKVSDFPSHLVKCKSCSVLSPRLAGSAFDVRHLSVPFLKSPLVQSQSCPQCKHRVPALDV